MKYLALLLVAAASVALPASTRGESRWAASVVTLDVTRKMYDFRQPWNTRTRSLEKSGLVIGPNEVLTTAEEVYDRTLVRLQKNGGGEWYVGDVAWVDYHANLAVVTCTNQAFWTGLKPVRFATAGREKALQIARWRAGNLEVRSAEFIAYSVRSMPLSEVNHVVLGCDSDIVGLNGGEPVISGGACTGMVMLQSGRSSIACPASLINFVLKARRANTYKGLGYFPFIWQPSANIDSLRRLKLDGPSRGVIVIDVPARQDGLDPVLKPADIILKVDGYAVDTMGRYKDPEYGLIMLENLSTQNRCAGDSVPLTVWRDGKEAHLSYTLPKYDYNLSVVPAARYDREPEFLIAGGLVFQPLNREYLGTFGADWRKNAPLRLTYYDGQPATKDRPALVVLSQVLPDPFNIGYQDYRFLVVDKVNGKTISRIEQLKEAFKTPVEGYHVIDFMKGESLRRMVLQAGSEEADATDRVLKRYGIQKAYQTANSKAP